MQHVNQFMYYSQKIACRAKAQIFHLAVSLFRLTDLTQKQASLPLNPDYRKHTDHLDHGVVENVEDFHKICSELSE